MEIQQLTFDFQTTIPHIVPQRGDEELKLRLGEFAGPLDLLLHLIKQEQVNIYDISIARITNEYLRYLRLMEKMDITVASDFLVMAAQLIETKTKMLLPRDPFTEETEVETIDPREELIQRLLEHQKFKSAAQMLWTKSTVEQSVFPRGKVDADEQSAEINVTVFDLISTFQKILARQKEEIAMEIEREEMSLSEMLDDLKKQLLNGGKFNLTEFFSKTRTRRELILAFLAALELVRTASVRLIQPQIFGDIFAESF
jgi:segregation and condensation protein A